MQPAQRGWPARTAASPPSPSSRLPVSMRPPSLFGPVHSSSSSSSRATEQRQRRRATVLLWTSPEVTRPLNRGLWLSIALGLLALVVIAAALITRASGTVSYQGWPSYGYYCALPGALMLLVGPLASSVRHLDVLRVLTGISFVLLLWETYVTVANVWWMVTYFTGTLPSPLVAHQSPGFMSFVTLTNILSVVLYLLHYLLMVDVCAIVPDLMLDAGLAPPPPPDNDDGEEQEEAARR